MALLDTLAGELLGPKSTAELCKTSGAEAGKVKKLVTASIPILLSGMYKNAGTEEGAESLSQAMDKHAPSAGKSTAAMLEKADIDDGKKIVKHLLGDSEKDVVRDLAKSTGMTQRAVTSSLGQLAPVLLSLMGNFKQEEKPQQSSSGLLGLLGGALLGNGYQQTQSSQQSGLNPLGLAGLLLGGGGSSAGSGSSGGSSGGSLLASLFGGGKDEKPEEEEKPKEEKPKKPKKPKTEKPKDEKPKEESGGLNLSGLLMGLLK